MGFEGQVPCMVGRVKLVEGSLVTVQLTDLEDNQVEIGTPVEMVARKLREEGGE